MCDPSRAARELRDISTRFDAVYRSLADALADMGPEASEDALRDVCEAIVDVRAMEHGIDYVLTLLPEETTDAPTT